MTHILKPISQKRIKLYLKLPFEVFSYEKINELKVTLYKNSCQQSAKYVFFKLHF